ncbi:MAG: YvrJ family protein [Clostridium sp.]|nr:YvrJ family protein [Clostridium sp.]MBQ9072687.1 YvrJ family protein [Bacilli bacterium]
METSLLELVANMGFPCVVTMYLLVRIEAKFDKLSDCMNELTISIRENNRG